MLIASSNKVTIRIIKITLAKRDLRSSRLPILVIGSLDDLKSRLAKVILMILIVTLFEEAINMKLTTPLDLVYLGASITLIALALYFSHAAEPDHEKKEDSPDASEQHGH